MRLLLGGNSMTKLEKFKKETKIEAEKAKHKMTRFYYTDYDACYRSWCEKCNNTIIITKGLTLTGRSLIAYGKAITEFTDCKGRI
jgi:hypothetical protein